MAIKTPSKSKQETLDNIQMIVGKISESEELTQESVEDIDEKLFAKYMYQDLPPIDLMIRTSGEQRISNFLIYNLSYAEMYFPQVCFPDFNEEEFEKAIDAFHNRDRRYGGNTKWKKE